MGIDDRKLSRQLYGKVRKEALAVYVEQRY